MSLPNLLPLRLCCPGRWHQLYHPLLHTHIHSSNLKRLKTKRAVRYQKCTLHTLQPAHLSTRRLTRLCVFSPIATNVTASCCRMLLLLEQVCAEHWCPQTHYIPKQIAPKSGYLFLSYVRLTQTPSVTLARNHASIPRAALAALLGGRDWEQPCELRE